MMLRTLLFVLAAFSMTPAGAQTYLSTMTTADLVQACNRPRQELAMDFCTGYILGVYDALSLSREMCPRESSAATLQAVAIARKYLNDHPELWDRAPPYLLATAFKQAFPCG